MRKSSLIIAAVALSLAACSSTERRPDGVVKAAAAGPGTLTPAALDRLIEESWQAAHVAPSPPADDLAFLRRATLDLIGRAPALGEIKVFIADAHADRRARLVDRLLASPEMGEHWGTVYAELLWREESKNRPDKQHDPRGWLVGAFNANVPYDKLAVALIAGSGEVLEHGALNFVSNRLRAGGPEALAGAAARMFLGVQIQCAQCHDHPYDPRWKQQDFWGLVAYFTGARLREDTSKSMAMPGSKTLIVSDQGGGSATMQRPGVTDGVTVESRFLGYRPLDRWVETPRRTFARAAIESDLFPKAMVGRTWAQLFGHGIMDPWDDLGAEHDPRHPPLLVKLAEDFRAGGFDFKRLLRQIVLSTAYARGSLPPAGADEDPAAAERAVRAFARAGMRTLSPEQLFRTLVVATGTEVMARHKVKNDENKAERMLAQALREYRFAFDDDEMAEADTFDGSMPQALLLLNGELTNNGARVGPEGVLGGILRSRHDPGDRIEEMMLAAYTRRPTAEEKALLLEEVSAEDQRVEQRRYEDVYFALLMSTEAVTNH